MRKFTEVFNRDFWSGDFNESLEAICNNHSRTSLNELNEWLETYEGCLARSVLSPRTYAQGLDKLLAQLQHSESRVKSHNTEAKIHLVKRFCRSLVDLLNQDTAWCTDNAIGDLLELSDMITKRGNQAAWKKELIDTLQFYLPHLPAKSAQSLIERVNARLETMSMPLDSHTRERLSAISNTSKAKYDISVILMTSLFSDRQEQNQNIEASASKSSVSSGWVFFVKALALQALLSPTVAAVLSNASSESSNNANSLIPKNDFSSSPGSVSLLSSLSVVNTNQFQLRQFNKRQVLTVGDSGEFPISMSSTYKEQPSVARLGSNELVVVWVNYVDSLGFGDSELVMQRVSADGLSLGSTEMVSDPSSSSVSDPAMASLSSGNVAIVWVDNSALDGSGSGVYARVKSQSTGWQTDITLITTTTTGEQRSPAITSISNTAAAFAWLSDGAVTLRFMSPTLSSITDEILVNAGPADTSSAVQLASLDTDEVVVCWVSAARNEIMARIYDDSGSPQTTAVSLTGVSADTLSDVSIIGLSSGNWVAAWQVDDGGDPQVFMQVFNNIGSSVTSANNITDALSGVQRTPVVGKTSDGFMVTWSGDGVGDNVAILCQFFDTVGNTIGDIFRWNEYVDNNQEAPAVASLSSSSNIATVWRSFQQGSPSWSVLGRLYPTNLALEHDSGDIGYDTVEPTPLGAIRVTAPPFVNSVNVTLTLSNPQMGVLETRVTANGAIATRDDVNGSLSVIGTTTAINSIIGNLHFIASATANSDVTIFIEANDGINENVTDQLRLTPQLAATITNSDGNDRDNNVGLIAGVVGGGAAGLLLLCCCIVASVALLSLLCAGGVIAVLAIVTASSSNRQIVVKQLSSIFCGSDKGSISTDSDTREPEIGELGSSSDSSSSSSEEVEDSDSHVSSASS